MTINKHEQNDSNYLLNGQETWLHGSFELPITIYLLAFSTIQFAAAASKLIAVAIALGEARRIFGQRWWWNGTCCYRRLLMRLVHTVYAGRGQWRCSASRAGYCVAGHVGAGRGENGFGGRHRWALGWMWHGSAHGTQVGHNRWCGPAAERGACSSVACK